MSRFRFVLTGSADCALHALFATWYSEGAGLSLEICRNVRRADGRIYRREHAGASGVLTVVKKPDEAPLPGRSGPASETGLAPSDAGTVDAPRFELENAPTVEWERPGYDPSVGSD